MPNLTRTALRDLAFYRISIPKKNNLLQKLVRSCVSIEKAGILRSGEVILLGELRLARQYHLDILMSYIGVGVRRKFESLLCAL